MKTKKKKNEEEIYNELDVSDENFAYIAGYTSNGFPYGITWDEYNKMKEETIIVVNNDDELPF